jgi:hypothetical protein
VEVTTPEDKRKIGRDQFGASVLILATKPVFELHVHGG